MNTWMLEETSFEPQLARKQESLFAQGNGYLGWRGSFEEGMEGGSLEGCYINGFYETYPIRYPETAYGYPEEGQTMLNLPNAKLLKVLVDGQVAKPMANGGEYSRTMDFSTGVLRRAFVYTSSEGKQLSLEFRRIISFERKHCAAIQVKATALNFTGSIEIHSGLDTAVSNQSADNDPRVGTHLPEDCFTRLELRTEGQELFALLQTNRTRRSLAIAATHTAKPATQAKPISNTQCPGLEYSFDVAEGESVLFEKYIAYCADEEGTTEIARRHAQTAAEVGFEALLQENAAYLQQHWKYADIEIEGDDLLQQGLRFNNFHILQSVGKDGLRNVAAKGLTGEGYEGHYFWDTEMYVIPSLLYSRPEICRSLLEYRYRHLEAARRRARQMGHKTGALYPWRTIGGDECSTFFPAGTAQYHINGDIALALKNYLQGTEDTEFLLACGAEMLFETARLWKDLGCFIKGKGFCINCVTGPDEYTAIVNNNYYTNMIARENLWYAHQVSCTLQQQFPAEYAKISSKIGLAEGEADGWKAAADQMYFPYDEESKVFLQDDSFAEKEKWDFAGTPKEQYPLLLHFHPLVIYRHQVLKQADVVLADFMLDKYSDTEQIRRNFAYYEPLTTHDSSLSACIHSIVACRIGEREKSYDYFLRSARTDLDDHKGNTKDGVHIANMAGTSMCVLNGFAGLRAWDGTLHLNPTIPQKWTKYSFTVRFKQRAIKVGVSKTKAEISLVQGEPLTIICCGKPLQLQQGTAESIAIE